MIKIMYESEQKETDANGNELTQEQIDFFSNSDIRENGKLLVCYHGTTEEFSQFGKGDIGFHFGTEKAADDRLNNINALKKIKLTCYLNIKNPLYFDDDVGDWVGYNIAWYMLKNNLVEMSPDEERIIKKYAVDQDNAKMSDIPENVIVNGTQVIKNFLKKKGYDGIKYKNDWEDRDSISYIAFYPEQIKLITNKEPTNSKNMNE